MAHSKKKIDPEPSKVINPNGEALMDLKRTKA